MFRKHTVPQDHTSQLVRRLYATLADSTHWPEVMEAICCEFEASGSALVRHDFAKGQGEIVVHCSHFPEAVASYKDVIGPSPCLTSDRNFQPGAVVLSAGPLEKASPAPPNEGRGAALGHQLFGVLERNGMVAELLFLGRAQSRPPFGSGAKRKLPQLLQHLGDVRSLARSLNAKLFERHALISLLDHVHFACILVNQSSHIRFANQAATELLSREWGLSIKSGRLCARTGDESLKLWKAVLAAAQSPGKARAQSEQHLILSGRSTPILLSLFPIDQDRLDLPRRPEDIVAIITKDGTGTAFESIAYFAAAYGLSPAEERLVQLLASGCGLFEAARELGISNNTARTHMRHVYGKVHVHSQASLVRLLSSIGAV
jgi:DNA-binding CsgD family transcriptional regulator